MTMSKLKPCPFCGSEKVKVVLEHDRTCGRCWFVRCQTCYSQGSSMVESMDRQEPEEAYEQIVSATNKAKEAWNRRAQDGVDQA